MSTPDRRTIIVDSGIELIATHGIRALTHRAIDGELDLPTGSTSYYFRTKRALIEAIVNRITTRSRADFVAAQLTAPSGPENLTNPETRTATAYAIAAWLDRLLAERRHHLIVRHALLIDLLGDAELHAQLAASIFSVERARDLFNTMGLEDPAAAAADFIALLEGLVFDRFVGARTHLTPGTQASVRQISTLVSVHFAGLRCYGR